LTIVVCTWTLKDWTTHGAWLLREEGAKMRTAFLFFCAFVAFPFISQSKTNAIVNINVDGVQRSVCLLPTRRETSTALPQSELVSS
jgi:hypothetical protein